MTANTRTPITDDMIRSDHEPDRAAHFGDSDDCVQGPLPGFAFRGPDFAPRRQGNQEPRQGDYCGSIAAPVPRLPGTPNDPQSYGIRKAEAVAIGDEHVATMVPKQWVVTVERVQTVQIVVDAFSYHEADYYGVRTEIPEDAWMGGARKAGFQHFTPADATPVVLDGDGIMANELP